MTADPSADGADRPLKQRWAAGQAWLGVWASLDDAACAEIVGRGGFDFVVTDLQHGYASLPSCRPLLDAVQATPAASLVRVPWNQPEVIMRALDLGADGVVVPMVSSGAEAAAAASACRYAPVGHRSWGPMRATTRGTVVQPGVHDRDGVCVVMVETADGLANLDQIVRAPGVDAIYVGPNDLALSLGLGRATCAESEQLRQAIQRVIDAAHQAGLPAGVDCATTDATQRWRGRGADFVIAASDAGLLARATGEAVAELRAAGSR